jgi:predicted DNA-binding WGR domain protein
LKLVKQLKLYFQEGTSDKVYEIDLCESGDGFLVNFRYGRRGASLKEGTKTIFPVPLPEAEKVFAALESEKRKKGYVAAGEAPVVTVSSAPATRSGNDKRRKAIVKLLKAAAAGEEPEHWQLSRIIWRAGDLKIKEAIPYIIQVADPTDFSNIYAAVWAIARCSTSDALGFLQNLQKNNGLPLHVQQIISEAILKLSDTKEKENFLNAVLESLPRPFRTSISAKDPKQFKKDLHEFLFELKTASNEYLIGIYQLTRNDASLHEVFLEVLAQIRFEHNYFKYIRKIFKTAEMLQDYSTYGVIAKQIEKQNPVYRSTGWMTPADKQTKAFSDKTKDYLTRRILRQLRKYGEANDGSYVELATEILLAFRDDQDLRPPYHTSQYTYNYNPQTRSHATDETRTHFDSYCQFQAFYSILYKNSGRYRQEKNMFVCVPPFTPGSAVPVAREEAYPHLWNDASEEIIQLLSFSKVNWVHDFALNVWNANPAFEKQVETIHIIRFLQAQSSKTQQLGLTLARKKYDPNQPDTVLLTALLDSKLEDARRQAMDWVSAIRSTLFNDTTFVVSLVKMRNPEAHAWLRGFLATHVFTREQAEIIIGSVIAFLLSADTDNEESRRYVNQVGDTLVISFGEFLRNISFDVIRDLFSHSSPDLHAFAGNILMKHAVKPEELPEDFLKVLLTSTNANTRGIGISLLARFPEHLLLQQKEILVSFCLSPLADVRNAVKPIIMRLTKAHPEFGKELVNLFVPAFLIKESYEGVHDDLLSLLSHELQDSLHVIPKERTLTLLNSRYRTSQLIGSILLKKTIADNDLTITELVKLASNPLQEVRNFVWDTFKKYPEKAIAAKEDAIKITDTDWDDTRIFAFEFFRNAFTEADWSTDLLILLCDSTREDVQDFAREMMTKFFKANQGAEYLLKLSQHPSSRVQLFTTAYLQEYASGNIEMIRALKSYFITLLSQVNKGKVAKARIMEFLRRESIRDEATALLAAEVFTRVSVSVAISERAACIAALRDIRKRYPAIQTPMTVKGFEDFRH